MTTDDFQRGDRVRYTPPHFEGDNLKGEEGRVVRTSDVWVFVLFDGGSTLGCSPRSLTRLTAGTRPSISNTETDFYKAPPVTDFKPLFSKEKYEEMITQFITDRALCVENLTEEQFAKCIVEALACGDFTKCVVRTPEERQGVFYLPYREHERMKAEIATLKKEIIRGIGLMHAGKFDEAESVLESIL